APVETLRHGGLVSDTAFSPDGQLVATASTDGTAGIWRASDGARLHVLQHHGAVMHVSFSKDGRRLATVSGHTGAVFDARTGKPLGVFRQKGFVTRAVLSPSGTLLATGAEDHKARLWNIRSGAVAHYLGDQNGHVTDIAFSPHGRLLVIASTDGDAR